MSAVRTPKFCWGCGKPLKDGQKFCTYCGKPVKLKSNSTTEPRKPTNLSSPSQPKTASFSPPKNPNSPYGQPKGEDLSSKYMKIIENQNKNANSSPTGIGSENPASSFYPATTKQNSDQNDSLLHEQQKIHGKVDNIEKLLSDVDIKKNFEILEYKLNALNIENKITDLENNITEVIKKPQEKDPQLLAKLDSLATKTEIQNLQDRIDNIDITTLNTIDSRLEQIEEKLRQPREDSDQIVNLAKNTVTRLNSLDERYEKGNLETRTRLKRLDDKMAQFDNRIEKFTSNLELLVPSLVKLTEKINQLQDKVTVLTNKTQKMEIRQKKLDLPPFPNQISPISPKPIKEPEVEVEKQKVKENKSSSEMTDKNAHKESKEELLQSPLEEEENTSSSIKKDVNNMKKMLTD